MCPPTKKETRRQPRRFQLVKNQTQNKKGEERAGEAKNHTREGRSCSTGAPDSNEQQQELAGNKRGRMDREKNGILQTETRLKSFYLLKPHVNTWPASVATAEWYPPHATWDTPRGGGESRDGECLQIVLQRWRWKSE